MGNASVYGPDEIRRRTAEFEHANRRDHTRFVLGFVVIAILMVVGTILALTN
jgi:hypothetical protein